MRLFLFLPLLLGFSVPVVAHNEANWGDNVCGNRCYIIPPAGQDPVGMGKGSESIHPRRVWETNN